MGWFKHHSSWLVEDEHVKAAQLDMVDSSFENQGISKALSLKHPGNIPIPPDTSNKTNDLSHPNIPILTSGFLHRRIPCMNDGSWMFRCEKENVEGVPWARQTVPKASFGLHGWLNYSIYPYCRDQTWCKCMIILSDFPNHNALFGLVLQWLQF